MTAWINHIIRGNVELYEILPDNFSDEGLAAVEKHGLQAYPKAMKWWETLSRAAMEHEDTRMMRYASGPALRVLRERLFPSETLEDVAALFEMNPGLLREIEEDKHPHPNMRAAYGHRLKEWAKAEEKEKEPKIEEPPPHTPIPNPDANLDGLQNRQGILLTPQQQQDRSEARRLATAILSRGKHGVGVWLSRKIGIPPFTISSFKASFFRNTEEAREHVEKFLAYMKQTTVDDVAAEFGATKEQERAEKEKNLSDFGRTLSRMAEEYGSTTKRFLEIVATRVGMKASTIRAYMSPSSNHGHNSKARILAEAAYVVNERKEATKAPAPQPEAPKQNPPFAVGQVWRTRSGDEVTIFYQEEPDVFYAWGDSNGTFSFSSIRPELRSKNADELVEYVRDTDLPRLEVGKTYRTRSREEVTIMVDDGSFIPFLGDNDCWYYQFGFDSEDPIVALVEEEPTQANQPVDDRYKEVLRIAVGHVVGDQALKDLKTQRKIAIECKEEIEESIRSAQAELAEYQATLAAFDVILQAQGNPDAFATPDKAGELFAAIDRLKNKDEVAA
jgi:hypothetical protein